MIKMTAFVQEMKTNLQRIKRKKQQDSDLAARVTTQHSVKLGDQATESCYGAEGE